MAISYTVERYKPYDNYVDDSDGGHMEKAVKIKVTAPIQWETVISLAVDDFTVAAVKAEAKKQLQEYIQANAPAETFTVSI